MKIKVLGCSGGIGGASTRTTCLLVDMDILIDAGTAAADLPLEALCQIDHIFLTHSHLDHIASLPFILDSTLGLRNRPIRIYALPQTINVLKDHIFNWSIWPDFTTIPDPASPCVQFIPIAVGDRFTLNGRTFTTVPANHVVPAVGYIVKGPQATLAFTGDTTTNPAFWPWINDINDLRYLIIETAFSNRERDLAEKSKHLCPSLLASELDFLKKEVEIFITHLKPNEAEIIMEEIHAMMERSSRQDLVIKPLETGLTFEI